MTTDQQGTTRAVLAGLTAEDALIAYAEHGTECPVDGDTIATARRLERARARVVRDLADLYRPIFQAVSLTMQKVQQAMAGLHRDAYVLTDPRTMERARQGHPLTPRQPLMHNGRKPRP